MSDAALLARYFEDARPAEAGDRRVGIEIETLFVDASHARAIGRAVSQRIMAALAADANWTVTDGDGRTIVELAKGESRLRYDLGWNLFELVTPAVGVGRTEELLASAITGLQELYAAARAHGATPLLRHCDGDSVDTLTGATQLDQLYRELNGPALVWLAHIAAVHYNIDLTSVAEGMSWMRTLNDWYAQRGWPPAESRAYWTAFLGESSAGYEHTRFIAPPETFDAYCRCLGGHRMYLEHAASGWHLAHPPKPLSQCTADELDMFVSFVWWWSRYRVRNGRLTLEIRAVPREDDERLETVLLDLRRTLEF